MTSKFRAAACHVAPVFLSARETTEKCIGLIHQATNNGANLVVFPESYIPAFPVWSAILPPTDNHEFFQHMARESLYVGGDEIRSICKAARTTSSVVSLGFSEKVQYSSATLFNSNIIIGSDGEILVHHRKLMPTFFEKLTWAPGDGFGLRVAETEHGKIGMLICGENTNPLARYAMMAQGEQVHISTWPAIWPTRVPDETGTGSPDSQDKSTSQAPQISSKPTRGANYDNISANRTRAAAHCFEAKCFGIVCASFLDQASIKGLCALSKDPERTRSILEKSPRAPTMFLDPTGALMSAKTTNGERETPTDFLQYEEGILYADLDLEDCIEGKQYHDVVGGYQRLDIFDLRVDRTRRHPARFVDSEADGRPSLNHDV